MQGYLGTERGDIIISTRINVVVLAKLPDPYTSPWFRLNSAVKGSG